MFRLGAQGDAALAEAASRTGRLLDEVSRSGQPLVDLIFQRGPGSVEVVERPYAIPVVLLARIEDGEPFDLVVRATREAMKLAAVRLESAGVLLPLAEAMEALDGAVIRGNGPGAPRLR